MSDCVLSSSIDGTIVEHRFDVNSNVEEAWRMPSHLTPVGVHSIDMVGSLAVAGLQSATAIAWRM